MRRRLWVLVLCACISAATAFGAEPDTRGYDALLGERLATMSIDGRPVVTAFDYVGLHARPEYARGLQMIRERLLAIPPSRMTWAEQRAWAINLYNFLVIERVMSHFTGGAPPAEPRYVTGFYDQPAVEIEGQSYSLERFERHFLFGDFPKGGAGEPPAALDPRIHFALASGTRGGPPLAAHPYRAATLDRDLDRAARNALMSRAHVRGNKKTMRWDISAIFDWYEADFGGRAGVVRFLRRYAPEGPAGQLVDRGERALGGFITWDWRLNQVSDEYREARTPERPEP
jgi:uncharacterized protein DUF547